MLCLHFEKPNRERLQIIKEKFGDNIQLVLTKKDEKTSIPINQIDTALAYQEEGWEIFVANEKGEVFYNPALSDQENNALTFLLNNKKVVYY